MELKEIFKQLEECFPKSRMLTGTYYQEWLKISQRFEEKSVLQTFDWVKLHERDIPPLSLWLAYCDEFQAQINSERHKKQLELEKQTANAFFKGKLQVDDYGKKCLRNINQTLSGEITKRQFLENCKELGIPMQEYIRKSEGDMDKPIEMYIKRKIRIEETS